MPLVLLHGWPATFLQMQKIIPILSDPESHSGDIEMSFTKDELLTNLTIYWATETISSSIRLYYESAHDQAANWGRVEVATAMANFPKDMFPTPRE